MLGIDRLPHRGVPGTATVEPDVVTAGIAVLGGVVGLISLASIAVFFAVGGPFGAINDWTVGLLGFLTGLLAVRQSRPDANRQVVPMTLAIVGAVIVVVGSALVISDATGFLLAGLVESVGFALIGVWLIWLNRSMRSTGHWPRRLPGLGLIAGSVMAIGFVLIPGVGLRLDDAATAPGWVWIGFVGWLGVVLLYPLWSIWFGLATAKSTSAEPSHNRTSGI
jgi:hypothetical protein